MESLSFKLYAKIFDSIEFEGKTKDDLIFFECDYILRCISGPFFGKQIRLKDLGNIITIGNSESNNILNINDKSIEEKHCKLNYVKEVATGFEYSFNCTDNAEINRIVSNFSANPSGENYGARTFEQVGLIRNGQVINNGKTKSYTGKWTILSKPAAKKGINYYFTYGGEDKCGNWVVYHTPTCYQF